MNQWRCICVINWFIPTVARVFDCKILPRNVKHALCSIERVYKCIIILYVNGINSSVRKIVLKKKKKNNGRLRQLTRRGNCDRGVELSSGVEHIRTGESVVILWFASRLLYNKRKHGGAKKKQNNQRAYGPARRFGGGGGGSGDGGRVGYYNGARVYNVQLLWARWDPHPDGGGGGRDTDI